MVEIKNREDFRANAKQIEAAFHAAVERAQRRKKKGHDMAVEVEDDGYITAHPAMPGYNEYMDETLPMKFDPVSPEPVEVNPEVVADTFMHHRAGAFTGQQGRAWTYSTIKTLIDIGVSDEYALSALDKWNIAKCNPTWSVDELKNMYFEAKKYSRGTPKPQEYPSLTGEAMLHKVTHKDTNPKDAVGTKKIPSTTRSSIVDMEVGVGMLEGARKYGRHNYRISGVRASVYIDATKRHLDKWWDFGEDIDPDSGLSHISKAICSLYVLRDAMINGKMVDDRPPPISLKEYDRLQKVVDEIFVKYPNALPAYTADDIV